MSLRAGLNDLCALILPPSGADTFDCVCGSFVRVD